MPSIPLAPRRTAALLLLAAVSTGTLGGMTSAASTQPPARCEISLSRSDGAVTLTALAHAEGRVGGSYSLRISGSGTDIRQGGPFEAAPGRAAQLANVTLGAPGEGYRADLDLDLGGETVSCSKRIGDGI